MVHISDKFTDCLYILDDLTGNSMRIGSNRIVWLVISWYFQIKTAARNRSDSGIYLRMHTDGRS